MKKTLKKLLCVILCFVLLFTTASVAFAVNAVQAVIDSDILSMDREELAQKLSDMGLKIIKKIDKLIENDSSGILRDVAMVAFFGFFFSVYLISTVVMFPINIVAGFLAGLVWMFNCVSRGGLVVSFCRNINVSANYPCKLQFVGMNAFVGSIHESTVIYRHIAFTAGNS